MRMQYLFNFNWGSNYLKRCETLLLVCYIKLIFKTACLHASKEKFSINLLSFLSRFSIQLLQAQQINRKLKNNMHA